MSTVLIVHAADPFRASVAAALERFGYTPVVAADVPGALAALRQGGVGLVLLDLFLPGGSGLDLLRAIHEDPALRPTPALVVTTLTDPVQLDQARALGAKAVLIKSRFSLDQLVAEVRRHLPA